MQKSYKRLKLEARREAYLKWMARCGYLRARIIQQECLDSLEAELAKEIESEQTLTNNQLMDLYTKRILAQVAAEEKYAADGESQAD